MGNDKNHKFEIDILAVPRIFNKLAVKEENNEKHLQGYIDIEDENGKIWDSYLIEIKATKSYPYRFPKLFEIGNSFPKNCNWHVNTDMSCCLDVVPNELLICRKGLNVHDFIKNHVIPYFANQTYRKIEGYYLYGEYSHGVNGLYEYYSHKLRANNPNLLVSMLDYIVLGRFPDRKSKCPFCKKTKFRHCHKKIFEELSLISWYLKEDLVNLRKLIQPSS